MQVQPVDHTPEIEPLRFRTGAKMLARLGSEQLRDDITAVTELVKNAYDADATKVVLELRDTVEGQRLLIEDDGASMTREDLDSKWAFLATENKIREDRSPIFKRRRLGQKGRWAVRDGITPNPGLSLKSFSPATRISRERAWQESRPRAQMLRPREAQDGTQVHLRVWRPAAKSTSANRARCAGPRARREWPESC